MIFHPKHTTITDGVFRFGGDLTAVAHPCLNKAALLKFWKNFTFGFSTLTVTETEGYRFTLGKAESLPLDGNAYSIRITREGVCISADGRQNLIHGLMTLLDRIRVAEEEDGFLELDCCEIRDLPSVGTRMVHFCIFPETELWELERFIRLCAALKYTHIVLEFWGMVKYDCMEELAWPHAYTKEELSPIMAEARDLGLEIIPMFNHWGHATASRVMHGKHVVLDQNPAKQSYFTEDGWCWDIRKPKVRELMRKIRAELTELCGEGKFFHVGCDEAYNFDLNPVENRDAICDYLNEISAEMTARGRRIILWGDMFLYRHPHYTRGYTCLSPSAEAEAYMLDRLSKDVVIADWQYFPGRGAVETSEVFVRAGFDTLICPFDCGMEHTEGCLETAKQEGMMGLLHTTWNTLSKGTPFVLMSAMGCYDGDFPKDHTMCMTYTAAVLRKASPVEGDYRRAGWAKFQTGVYH